MEVCPQVSLTIDYVGHHAVYLVALVRLRELMPILLGELPGCVLRFRCPAAEEHPIRRVESMHRSVAAHHRRRVVLWVGRHADKLDQALHRRLIYHLLDLGDALGM